MGYTRENLRTFDTPTDSSGNCTAATAICDQAALGQTSTSAVLVSLARDTRDFTFDPKSGARNVISYQHAGTFLGGTNEYYKVNLESSRHRRKPNY